MRAGGWKVTALIVLCICGFPLSAQPYPVAAGRVTVAVFPFRDLTLNTLEKDISGIIATELARHAFIEVVPVNLTLKEGYEIEPLFLWTEMREGEKRGGMLWAFRPFLTEETSAAASAEILLYGDMTKSEEGYRLDVFAVQGWEQEPAWSWGLSRVRDDELSLRAADAAGALAEWVNAAYALRFAEEDVRQYLGGMVSHEQAVSRLHERLDNAPQSLPLRALLFDLYRRDSETHQDQMLREAEELIRLLGKGSDADLRYLLSRDVDPFDAAASSREKKEAWQSAISLRERALREYPAHFEVHKRALGRDYYGLGRSHEKEGRRHQAGDAYERALRYLTPSSELYEPALSGLERVRER